MKIVFYFILFTSLILSCQTNENPEKTDIQVTTKNVVLDDQPKKSTTGVTIKNKVGEVITYFPNGKIDTEGWNDKDTLRDGVWYSYYETGVKWSEQSYNHGLKDGRSVVYFPNGKIHYEGEYKDDKKFGHWIFYNEAGEIENEKNY